MEGDVQPAYGFHASVMAIQEVLISLDDIDTARNRSASKHILKSFSTAHHILKSFSTAHKRFSSVVENNRQGCEQETVGVGGRRMKSNVIEIGDVVIVLSHWQNSLEMSILAREGVQYIQAMRGSAFKSLWLCERCPEIAGKPHFFMYGDPMLQGKGDQIIRKLHRLVEGSSIHVMKLTQNVMKAMSFRYCLGEDNDYLCKESGCTEGRRATDRVRLLLGYSQGFPRRSR